MADVLEHADAHHLVVSAVTRQVAVIQQLQRHLVFQALGLDPLATELELLLAEGNAVHLHAKFSRGQARQPAPAAADIEQLLARLQPQLAAQVAQLGQLGRGQVLGAGLVVGARVHHLRVEPELVERIGQVVVVMDGLGVGGLVVAFANVVGIAVVVVAQRAAQGIGSGDHFTDRPLDVHTLLDVGATEDIETGMGDLSQQGRIANDERHLRIRPKVESLGLADADTQRQLQGQQLRGQVGVHAYLLVTGLKNYRPAYP